MKHRNLLVFLVIALLTGAIGTFAYVYYAAPLVYNLWEQSIVQKGIGGGPIPVNTLYTEPNLPSASSASQSTGLETAGANRDTLYTIGVLDLSKGPEILSVPDMAGRYYVVQFVGSRGDDFSAIGTRTTGTQAGNFLISGPGWHGTVPNGVTQIHSPDKKVLVAGRVLVKSEGDLAAVYQLSTQIHLTPLSKWQPTAPS